jgi:hypothetical protein
MANQAAEKRVKQPPPSRAGKGPTPGSWTPGRSGNPGGRPRKAFAACEAVRENVDPNEWVAAELAVARDQDNPWEVRRDAWRSLIDRGFVRPPAGIDARISQDSAPERDFAAMSIDDHRKLLELLDRAPMAHDRTTAQQEPESTQLPTGVQTVEVES